MLCHSSQTIQVTYHIICLSPCIKLMHYVSTAQHHLPTQFVIKTICHQRQFNNYYHLKSNLLSICSISRLCTIASTELPHNTPLRNLWKQLHIKGKISQWTESGWTFFYNTNPKNWSKLEPIISTGEYAWNVKCVSSINVDIKNLLNSRACPNAYILSVS